LGDFGFAIPENIAKNTDFGPQARKDVMRQRACRFHDSPSQKYMPPHESKALIF
jgi:hypothetical protein